MFRIACIQMKVTPNKLENLQTAKKYLLQASLNNTQIAILPECFNAPYSTLSFKEYAEEIPGETSGFLKEMAVELGMVIVGGSIPEKCGEEMFNTCTVWGSDGAFLGSHRKVYYINFIHFNHIFICCLDPFV